MDKNEYMSGCQLRQYLHISTRKLKHLMDYNLIPHINTGHATHKYLVKLSDAQEFMKRKESEPRFMAEIYKRYATPKIRKPVIIIEPTKENGKMFGKWLTGKWNDVPEAIRLSDAPKYTGFADKRIRKWVKNENIESIVIGSYRYMLKTSLIKHISKPEQLINTSIQGYAELMRDFKKGSPVSERTKNAEKNEGWKKKIKFRRKNQHAAGNFSRLITLPWVISRLNSFNQFVSSFCANLRPKNTRMNARKLLQSTIQNLIINMIEGTFDILPCYFMR